MLGGRVLGMSGQGIGKTGGFLLPILVKHKCQIKHILCTYVFRILYMKGQDHLRKRVEDMAWSLALDQTDKVSKALRAVHTLAGKGRDPSLMIDPLEDLIAAATRAEIEESRLELYKKVRDQCRKMEHLGLEDFGSLCLCLLQDNVDQKIAEGMARFNKMRRRAEEAKSQQTEKAVANAATH